MPQTDTNIDKLLSLSGPPLGPPVSQALLSTLGRTDTSSQELAKLLANKNGFFAFEGALHVLPLGSSAEGYDAQRWNSNNLWKSDYGDAAKDCWFFGEDVFGEQFCLYDGSIWRFDPETGNKKQIGASLEDWAHNVLDNYDFETGYSLAHAWQEQFGPLPNNERLVPKKLFVFGGEYKLDNLYAVDAIEGMKFRANIAQQIRNLPDGAQVRIKVTD